MVRRKNSLDSHFKKPAILLIIGLAVIGIFWLSFISITTKNDTASHAAASTDATYAAGRLLFVAKKGYVPSQSTIRSISGYSDATVEKLYNDFYILTSDKLLKDFKSLSSSARNAATTVSPDTYTARTISKLKANSNILEAVPDKQITFLVTPNDSEFPRQWGLKQIEMEAGWDQRNNNEVVVGVLDTGVEWTHPELKNMMWTNFAEKNGTKGVDDDRNGIIDDDHGFPAGSGGTLDGDSTNNHGTHVAGIIAAQWNNAQGIAGICPNCKIMVLKALNDDRKGWESNVIKSMAYAINQKSKGLNIEVINHSYKIGASDLLMEEMFSTAERMGIISVAAAGNDSALMSFVYPAQYTKTDMVFSVIATTYDDKKASFSNYGKTDDFVDFSAPGDDIYSLSKTGYRNMDGTSMAAPHVSGLIANMKSIKSSLKYSDIKAILRETSDNIDSKNHSSYAGYLGFGRINARKAMTRVWNDANGSQQPTTTPTTIPPVSNTYQLTITSPSSGFTYATPLTVGVKGSISGPGAPNTVSIELKVYKSPVSSNTPVATKKVTELINTNGTYSFSAILSTGITTPGDYILQVIPYNATSAMGNPKEIPFKLVQTPPTATRTPSPTPRSGTIITPTGASAF